MKVSTQWTASWSREWNDEHGWQSRVSDDRTCIHLSARYFQRKRQLFYTAAGLSLVAIVYWMLTQPERFEEANA